MGVEWVCVKRVLGNVLRYYEGMLRCGMGGVRVCFDVCVGVWNGGGGVKRVLGFVFMCVCVCLCVCMCYVCISVFMSSCVCCVFMCVFMCVYV